MKHTFTPGPWLTEENENGECHVMDDSGYAIADMAVEYSGIESIEEHEANARLIAAAPELLVALQGIMDLYVPTKDINSTATAARAAIAKATGGT